MKSALKTFTALTAATAAVASLAQAAQAADAPPADTTTVQEVVVTGVAGGAARRKLDAGYAITTIKQSDIEVASPKTSAEILTLVPGVWVESSGGVGTANIFVRGIPSTGDAPFVTMQINGVPVYPAPTLSFMDNSALVRIDQTVSGVEAVRGGPAMVFSNGQPGLTTNFTLKEGGEETHGLVQASTSTYDLGRVDVLLDGKLADDLYYMVGGYATSSPGVRNAQFDSEQGKQFTVNITKKFADGKLNLFARYTDDHGEWYLPFPQHVPGVNLGTFNQLGDYSRYWTIQTGPTTSSRFDLGNGRGWKGLVAGGSFEYRLGEGFTFRDRFGITDGDDDTYGLVPDGNAVSATALAAAAGHPITTLHTGTALGANDYVQALGAWVVQKKLKAVTNEASVEKKIANNDITVGYYFSRFTSDDFWSLGHFTPMQVKSNGDFVNATCADMQAAGSGSGCWAYGLVYSGTATVNAVYVADSWQITDQIRIDAAVRDEDYKLDFNDITGPGYPDPTNPANFFRHDMDVNKASFTVGANWMFMHDMGVFARYSKGTHFPSFDDVRGQDYMNEGLESYEAGYKFHNRMFDAYVTGFYDKVTNAFLNDVGGVTQLDNTSAEGAEIDARWTSSFGLSLNGNATVQHTRIDSSNIPSFVGHKAPRQPDFQMRLTPEYRFDAGPAKVTLYGTWFHTDDRFSDSGNLQSLPGFDKIDAGVIAEVNHLTLQVAGDNLTDSHGLTEGDPRSLISSNARPIFGRSLTFSLGWKF